MIMETVTMFLIMSKGRSETLKSSIKEIAETEALMSFKLPTNHYRFSFDSFSLERTSSQDILLSSVYGCFVVPFLGKHGCREQWDTDNAHDDSRIDG